DMAGNSIDEEIDWQVEHKTDILTSSAEFVNEIFKKLESIKKGNDWDMAIAIGDLPSISNRKAVLSDFDHEEKTSLISVPALGVFKSKKKLEMLLLYHMEVLYGKGESEDTEAIQPNFISLLLVISILIFVPMGLFETWTDVEVNVTWPDYLTLIWFTSSLGVLAGAFGSTVEEEDKIRNITYSYRQLFRYRQL